MNQNNDVFLKQTYVNHDKLGFSNYIHSMLYKDRGIENESPAWKKDLGRNEKITLRDLAVKYGMKYEQFRKGINKERPFKERDEIIMICFVLHLDDNLTNKALELYGFLPLFHDEDNSLGTTYNRREDILIDAVDNSFEGKNVSFNTVNQQLIAENLQPLQINSSHLDRNYSSPFTVVCDPEYLSIQSFYPRYNDLASKYSLNDICFKAKDYIVLKESNKKLVLEYSEFDVSNSKHVYDVDINNFINPLPLNSSDIDYSLFDERFTHLKNTIKRKKKELYKRLDDTKNYQTRVSANFINGYIHVFAETYSYSYPELNEYYFVDYCNGITTYSISHKSKFLYYQLGETEYNMHFSKYNDNLLFVTNNLDELKDFSHETRWNSIFDMLNSNIERKFRTLNIKINELLCLIKNKKILIRNANDIFDGPNFEYEICNFFNCSDIFEFKINSEIDFEYPEKIYTPSYRVSELKIANETISISIDDIITAFNFGVNSIDNIFDIKKEFKDMNNWINSL